MNFAQYIIDAQATANYPIMAGFVGSMYLSLKFAGEAAELLDAVMSGAFEQVDKECGDVLWYAGQITRELNLGVEASPDRLCLYDPGLTLKERAIFASIAVGKFNECFGKAIRDDGFGTRSSDLSPERRSKLSSLIEAVLLGLNAVANYGGMSLQQIADGNIAKLKGRLARGTIHGDGDAR